MKLFAEAKGISVEYKRSAKLVDRNFAILDVQADMDDLGQTLHEKMRELCITRQNGTTLCQKVKWALHGRSNSESRSKILWTWLATCRKFSQLSSKSGSNFAR
ncbi:hypothetical protein EJ04DRAFT_600076 [Polyplosphaeria fusca]|uniref:Uncharacterized protein n=1 Tax=Polyplosphaeria fusca TaxID=682080 RepID=A0A9P4V3R0_9PLEO|nr:hypothetical protein EJ04DRAFT_600076 [Polyplosphaeria fusca]